MAREAVRDRWSDPKRKVRELLVLESIPSPRGGDRCAADRVSPTALFPIQTFVSPRSAHPSLHSKKPTTQKNATSPVLTKMPAHNSLPSLSVGSRVMGHSLGSSTEGSYTGQHLIKVAARTMTGCVGGVEKTNNQDTCFTGETNGWRVMGVCDGHGVFGHHVSGYLKSFFPRYTLEHFSPADTNFPPEKAVSALKSAFQRCSRGLRESVIDCINSGSTCVAVVWHGDTLVCGNVGDSRAVLGRFTNEAWSAEPVSDDHKPEKQGERERIEAAGGEVSVSKLVGAGPFRVYVRRQQYPGLAMSRSMGDEMAKGVGVTAEPDISVTTLSKEHKFVIVASDGVWEFIPNIEAVRIVALHWETGDAIKAVTALVKAAQYRWSMADNMMDDITATVAFFNS